MWATTLVRFSNGHLFLRRLPSVINTHRASRHFCKAAAELEPVEAWVNPKLAQSEELAEKAYSFLSDKQQWHDAFPLLESAAELQERTNGADQVDPRLSGTLAVVYHELKKHKLAEDHFVSTIQVLTASSASGNGKQKLEATKSLGFAYVNFSALLVDLGRHQEALDNVTKGLQALENAGEDVDTYYASALANRGNLLAYLDQLTEARDTGLRALDIFVKNLGRDNKYTRTCFSNLVIILKKLEDEQGIQQLKERWESCDKVTASDVPGLSKKEIADITEELSHTIKKAYPKLNPWGPTKGPKLYSKEVRQFLEYWEKTTGKSVVDSAYLPVLKQEIAAIRQGHKVLKQLGEDMRTRRLEEVEERKTNAVREVELQRARMERMRRGRDYKTYVEEEHYTKKIFQATGTYKQWILQGMNDHYEPTDDWDWPNEEEFELANRHLDGDELEEEVEPKVYEKNAKGGQKSEEGAEEGAEGEVEEAKIAEGEVEEAQTKAAKKPAKKEPKMIYDEDGEPLGYESRRNAAPMDEWPDMAEFLNSLTPDELDRAMAFRIEPKIVPKVGLEDGEELSQRRITKEYKLLGSDLLFGKTREVRRADKKGDDE